MTDQLSQTERKAMLRALDADIRDARAYAVGSHYRSIFERAWRAARDCLEVELSRERRRAEQVEEREQALEEALRFYADPIRLIKFVEQHNRADANDRERGAGWWAQKLSTIASDALAASQPEVLSERSETEPGEPEGQPMDAHKTIHHREGTVPCPKCGMSLSPSEYAYSHKCSGPFQPDHGPGEPKDPKRCSYCGETFPVPVEFHHAEADCPGLKRRLQVGESNG